MKKRFGFSILGAILVSLAAFFVGLRMVQACGRLVVLSLMRSLMVENLPEAIELLQL
jgi:hypothetical protein